MIKTQILLWKTTEANKRLRVRFLLFYSELVPIDPWYNMLQTLLGQKKSEKAMSDEHPRNSKYWHNQLRKASKLRWPINFKIYLRTKKPKESVVMAY